MVLHRPVELAVLGRYNVDQPPRAETWLACGTPSSFRLPICVAEEYSHELRKKNVNGLSIGYHDVLGQADLSLPPDVLLYCLDRRDFCEHLCAIRQQAQGPVETLAGFRLWYRHLPVFLTFDDGNLGAYECAAADLERHGWRGHFFVTTDWIGRRGFMDKSQIRELHERGHVIGSHSRSHPARMSALSTEELLEEWGESCARLSDILGDRVVVASVADGYYSDKVGRTAAASGIQALFTSEPTTRVKTIDGCLVLGRYVIQRGMPASTSGAIAAGRVWPRWRQMAEWEAKKVAKAVGGQHYLTVRQRILTLRHIRNRPTESKAAKGGPGLEFAERIVLLSKANEGEHLNRDGQPPELDRALSILSKAYAPFAGEIVGKTVLDFSCGLGWQVLAMASSGADRSVGIEGDPAVLQGAKDFACQMRSFAGRVEFHPELSPELCGVFDLVIFHGSMKHFPDPAGTLRLMRRALRPCGRILITCAPYRGPVPFFAKLPRVNLFFRKGTVSTGPHHFRNGDRARHDEIKKVWNRISLREFERLVAECEMRPVYWKLECVKGLDWLAKIPLLREFFVSQVTFMLAETSREAGTHCDGPSDNSQSRQAPTPSEEKATYTSW